VLCAITHSPWISSISKSIEQVSSQTNNSGPISRRGAETKSLGMWNFSMKVLHRQCRRGGYLKKIAVLYSLPSNTTNLLNPTLHPKCFGHPWPSSGIKVRNLKPVWTRRKSILQFLRPHKFKNTLNTCHLGFKFCTLKCEDGWEPKHVACSVGFYKCFVFEGNKSITYNLSQHYGMNSS